MQHRAIYKIISHSDLIEVVFENSLNQLEYLASIGVYYEDQKFMNQYLDFKEISKKNLPVMKYLGFNFSKDSIVNYVYRNESNNLLKTLSLIKNNYYMISYLKGDESTRKHELAHYEFWKSIDLQKLIFKLSSSKLYSEIENGLIKLGYCKEVVPTEIYAFSKIKDTTLPIKLNNKLQLIKCILNNK
jgi:hypothetical protein